MGASDALGEAYSVGEGLGAVTAQLPGASIVFLGGRVRVWMVSRGLLGVLVVFGEGVFGVPGLGW